MNIESKTAALDYSERADGPSLIAIRGDDEPENEYRLGTREYDWHEHLRGQVFCVETGLIQVTMDNGSWLLPPHRAGWIPPGISHRVRVSGALSGWTLFLAPHLCENLPDHPCVVGISEVLRVLALRASEWGKEVLLTPEQERIAAVIGDELCRAPHETLHLPVPGDPRLKKIFHALIDNPGSERTLEDWASFGTMSSRTMRRLVVTETGMTFGKWRQQSRLMQGLEMLVCGIAVGDVSDKLGYASPSNFIAMFKQAFGVSPARYISGKR